MASGGLCGMCDTDTRVLPGRVTQARRMLDSMHAGASVLLRVTAKHRHECKMRPVKRRHVYNVINKTQSRDL